jgi:DNA-binding CsgD family transcriptional regulator
MRGCLPAPVRHPDELTATERRVLDLLATGATDRQIARALGISPHTVRQHCTHIYHRMPGPTIGNPRILAARWHWETQGAHR